MVVPEAVVISPAGFLSSSSPFMPSLKPFTAPPRSVPMLRSFFVPKMSSTMTSTISQCQMLNEPIEISWSRGGLLGRGREHAPEGVRAADDVYMEMIHVLPADPAGVDDGSESL